MPFNRGEKIKANRHNKKAVINCRGEIFPSITAAGNKYNLVHPSNIAKVVGPRHSRHKTAGKYADGTKTRWALLDTGNFKPLGEHIRHKKVENDLFLKAYKKLAGDRKSIAKQLNVSLGTVTNYKRANDLPLHYPTYRLFPTNHDRLDNRDNPPGMRNTRNKFPA